MDERQQELEWAHRAATGDRAAMEHLLTALYDQVHALCRRVVGNDADADDATQNAMISVARSIHRFDGRSAVRTWVYRIATNAALDELRRRSRRPTPGEPVDHLDATTSDAPDLASSVIDRLDLDAAMARVAPDFRVAVVLRDVLGLEYAEIAEVQGLPIGTVRSRIARGRRQLANLVDLGNRSPTHDVQTDAP